MPGEINYSVDLSNSDEVDKEIIRVRGFTGARKAKHTSGSKTARECIAQYIKQNEDGTETVITDAGGLESIQKHIDTLATKSEDVDEAIEWIKALEEKATELTMLEDDPDRKKVIADLDAESTLQVKKHGIIAFELSAALAKLKGKASSAPKTIAPAASTSCGDRQTIWKPHAHFKPPVLQSDMSPDELDEWMRKFEAWIPQADARSQGVLIINLLLEEVMSPTVQSLIGFSTALETPIFSDESGNSIMERLTASWLVRYPILRRRREFLQPQDSENFNQMSTRILKRSRKADLANMLTQEALIAHVFITNLYAGGEKYKKILDKILHSNEFKDGNITVNDITAIANAEETVDHLLAPANTNETPDPHWVGKMQPGKSSTQKRRPLNPKLAALKEKGLCFSCAGSHKPRECPANGKTCTNCQKKNHFAKACCSEKVSKPNNQ